MGTPPEYGPGLVEYGLIIFLLLVVVVAALILLGPQVLSQIGSIINIFRSG